MSTIDVVRLSDSELVAEVARLARSERQATARLIAQLAELYARRLHHRAGYSSLFTYCVGVLALSESAAYDRMKAAKLSRRFPEILALLVEGRLNLTTIRLVAGHLTRENHAELLAAVAGKSKRQVLEVLAQRFPEPDVPASVRKLPTRRAADAPESTGAHVALDSPRGAACPTMPATIAAERPAIRPAAPHSPPRELMRPLSPDRYQVTFTASGALREKLELAQDLLRHVLPGGDPAQVLERALDVLVDELVRRKFAVTDRPRLSHGQLVDSRSVPAEVKRAVYIRDRGCCAYVSPDGHRCGARGFLEFHHVIPYAAGGQATVENISLRCRAHNAYEAEVFYGPTKAHGGIAVVRDEARVMPDTFSFRNENGEAATACAGGGLASRRIERRI